MIFVLEQRPEQPDGSVRALVAVDGEGDGEEGSAYTSSYAATRLAAQLRRSPIGWVTAAKEGSRW